MKLRPKSGLPEALVKARQGLCKMQVESGSERIPALGQSQSQSQSEQIMKAPPI